MSLLGSRSLFSIETQFCALALGMTKFQYLSRGSSFLVQSNRKVPHRLALVTCAHIVHPFSFPFYYKEDFEALSKVRRDELQFQMKMIHPETGQVQFEVPLEPDMLRMHPTLDLCFFLFPQDTELLTVVQDFSTEKANSVPFSLHPQPADKFELHQGDTVQYSGFNYSHNKFEQELLVHHSIRAAVGSVVSSGLESTFRPHFHSGTKEVLGVPCSEFRFSTPQTLEFGMCGGPVTKHGELVGMVEGVAPDGTAHCLPVSNLIQAMMDHEVD